MFPKSLLERGNEVRSTPFQVWRTADMLRSRQDRSMQHRPATHAAKRALSRAGIWAAIGLALAWTIFPIWWAFASSLKPLQLQYGSLILPVIQFPASLDHWKWEWNNRYEVNGLY